MRRVRKNKRRHIDIDHQEKSSVLVGDSDIISNLPDNVIDTILMHLPTRDAVRTSILARKWRYRWAKLPQLILDKTLWNQSLVKHPARLTIARILYQLLLLHEGPIIKFSLSIPDLESCPEIDNLILFLSRNSIEDLTLEIWNDEHYRLPQSFSKCHQLRHLTLRSCSIETPPEFKGFNRLITLKLCQVSVSAKMLGCLVSRSPFLELMDLRIYSSFLDLRIDAPNLKTFKFRGILKSLIFKKVPRLASVSIKPCILGMKGKNNRTGIASKLDRFFCSLPVIEKLRLGNHLVKFLAAEGVPTKLSTTLVYLKTLKISNITLADMDKLSLIFCLMRSSPNLERLDIQVCGDTGSNTDIVLEFLEEQNSSDIIPEELKEVKLQNVIGTGPEMEFVKLLLAKSPSLEKMLIQHEKQTPYMECKILNKLIQFPRASKGAEVIYEEIKGNLA